MTSTDSPSHAIIRPVTDQESRSLSPWPDRIRNGGWKRERSNAQIDQEYDRERYLAHLEAWRRHIERTSPHAGIIDRFFDRIRRTENDKLAAMPHVYGDIDLKAYLVSVADRLYAADLNVFEAMWRHWVIEQIAELHQDVQFDHLIELGFGNGVNLFRAFNHIPLKSIGGMEVGTHAVELARTIATDCGIPGSFTRMSIADCVVTSPRPWALLTIHAMEQVPDLSVDWFDRMVKDNPPRIGIHFEPMHFDDDCDFANQCRRYAQINGYNQDLASIATQAADRGVIRIRKIDKRVMGHSAFNPTSLLVWEPC